MEDASPARNRDTIRPANWPVPVAGLLRAEAVLWHSGRKNNADILFPSNAEQHSEQVRRNPLNICLSHLMSTFANYWWWNHDVHLIFAPKF